MQRADVQLVNSSLKDLGDSLLQERMLAQKESDDQDKATFRNRQVGVEQARWDATQAHQQRLESIESKRYDAQAANQLGQQTTAANWHNQQQDQQTLQRAISANAQGQLDDAGRSDVNDWLAGHPYFSATGIQLAKPPVRSDRAPAAVATVTAAQNLRSQADDLESQSADEADPDQSQALLQQAGTFRAQAQILEDHLKKNPPAGVRSSSTKKNPLTGDSTTISGPMDQVNAALGVGNVAAGTNSVIRMVRDKTGRLIPSK